MGKNLFILCFGLISFNLSAQCWQTVSPGGAHTMAIRTGGTLWTWGRNNYGQLGVGTSVTSVTSPTQVGTATNWDKISSGNSHCVAIKTDGTLWTWGSNQSGQLGNGTTTNSNIPIQIGSETDWLFIAAGDEFTFAIKNNHTLWAWGLNTYGQLGDNTTVSKNTPTQIGTETNWQIVNAGTDHTVAIKSNGTLWAWGKNNVGQLGDNTNVNKNIPTQIGTDTDWQNCMASILHSIATKTNSSLWTWGGNNNGQLGNGTTTDENNPIQINSITNCGIIAKGHQHTIVKKADNTLFSWGGNASGQLGDATNTQKTSPNSVYGSATDWLFVNSRVSHTVALKTDGTLYTWGANLYGQLGDGTTTAKNTPVVINCPTLSSQEYFLDNNIRLFPNPASSKITIKTLSNDLLDSISVKSIYGTEIIFVKGNQETISIESLASGVYFIEAIANNKKFVAKFIKN